MPPVIRMRAPATARVMPSQGEAAPAPRRPEAQADQHSQLGVARATPQAKAQVGRLAPAKADAAMPVKVLVLQVTAREVDQVQAAGPEPGHSLELRFRAGKTLTRAIAIRRISLSSRRRHTR